MNIKIDLPRYLYSYLLVYQYTGHVLTCLIIPGACFKECLQKRLQISRKLVALLSKLCEFEKSAFRRHLVDTKNIYHRFGYRIDVGSITESIRLSSRFGYRVDSVIEPTSTR